LKTHKEIIPRCAMLLHGLLPVHSVQEYDAMLASLLHSANQRQYFDEKLWGSLIDKIEVSHEGALHFHLIDGSSIIQI